jgi:hypothetical protein
MNNFTIVRGPIFAESRRNHHEKKSRRGGPKNIFCRRAFFS